MGRGMGYYWVQGSGLIPRPGMDSAGTPSTTKACLVEQKRKGGIYMFHSIANTLPPPPPPHDQAVVIGRLTITLPVMWITVRAYQAKQRQGKAEHNALHGESRIDRLRG